jgi:uncharacterized protein YkwD
MQTRPPVFKAALGAVALLVATLAIPLGAVAATAAHASAGSDESRFLSLTNQLRASVGAPALSLDAGMSNVARSWSQQMAASGGISHNPNRQTQITGWSVLGENVGMGSTVDILNNALVNSPAHYENLVDRDFTLVGIGVAYGPNMVYVTEDFMAPAGGGGGSSDVPQAEPDPAPAPVVEEAPAPTPRATTTAPPETVPVTAPQVAPPPPPAPAPVPVSVQLRPVVDQVRQWMEVFFPGSDPSVPLNHAASNPGNGRRGY